MGQQAPFFSVVIPTLNEEDYLPRLLGDLVEQTFGNFEVVVVDGKSEDRTREKALEFEGKLKLKFFETRKRSAAYQRNFGGKKTRGKYLAFIDADIRIPDNYLEAANRRLRVNPVEVLTTWVKPDTGKSGDKLIADILNYLLDISRHFSPACLGSNMIVRREAFEAVGGFDVKIKYGEDTVLAREIEKNGGEYVLLKKPQAVWSFRRFEREGRGQAILEYLILNLHLMIGDPRKSPLTYAMGGKAKDKSKVQIKQVKKIQEQIRGVKEKYGAKLKAHPEIGPAIADLKRGWEKVKAQLEG